MIVQPTQAIAAGTTPITSVTRLSHSVPLGWAAQSQANEVGSCAKSVRFEGRKETAVTAEDLSREDPGRSAFVCKRLRRSNVFNG